MTHLRCLIVTEYPKWQKSISGGFSSYCHAVNMQCSTGLLHICHGIMMPWHHDRNNVNK